MFCVSLKSNEMEEERGIFVEEAIYRNEVGEQEDFFDEFTNEELEDILEWLQEVEQQEDQEDQRGGAIDVHVTNTGFRFSLEQTRERKNRRFNVNEQDYYLMNKKIEKLEGMLSKPFKRV